MICATPTTSGPNRGEPNTGTNGGYHRHLYHGEKPCAACVNAHNNHVNKEHKPRVKGEPLTTGVPARRSTDPAIVGWVVAVCTRCGHKGKVNRKLVGASASATRIRITSCTNCRTTPDLKNMMRRAQEAKQGL